MGETDIMHLPVQKKGTIFKLTLRQGTFLYLFKKWSWIIMVAAAAIQCIFFFSIENIFGTAIILVAWKLTLVLVMRRTNLAGYSLSTFIIVGYSITQYFIPIIFTLLEGKGVTYNLKFPYQVFLHSILAFGIMIGMHLIYSEMLKVDGKGRRAGQRAISRLGLFIVPSRSQIWMMGMFGLTSMFVTYFFVKHSYENISEGIGNKFIEGFIPFAFAPFFLLIGKLFGKTEPPPKYLLIKLALFGLGLIAIGVGGNSRSILIIGPTGAFLGYFLGLLSGHFGHKIFTAKNIIAAGAGLWLITGPLSDVGTAMLVVREQRGSISKMEMLRQTLRVYGDKEALRFYKEAAAGRISSWNETYFDNIFLARFSNLKFNDASLEQAEFLGKPDPLMFRYSINRLLAIFPQPVLSFFQLDIDKSDITSSSYGDFLYYRAKGGVSALGGFRTGQFSGTGMAAFGWWYLLVLAVGLIPLYYLVDIFVLVKKSGQGPAQVYISLAGLLSITSIFMFFSLSSNSESVMNIFTFIIRGWIQMVVLYAVIFYLTRLLSEFLSSRRIAKKQGP